MQPGNPIVGGTTLRIPAIASPGFTTGSTGWSINADGTAEFNGLTLHGTLVLGTGANNVIILDFTRRAIFMYDAFGHLVGSMAASGGNDSFGTAYQAGLTSYLSGTPTSYSQLLDNALTLSTADASQVSPFKITPNATGASGPGGDQPLINIFGATDHTAVNIPAPVIEMFGANASGSAAPFIRMRSLALVAMDLVHQGTIKWAAPGAANYGETWHALPLATNWANQGGAFGAGSYQRMNNGTVRFTGAIAWTAAASNAPVTVIGAGNPLPAAYRPLNQKRCLVMSMPADTTPPTMEGLNINTDGTVTITNFANGTGPISPISLDTVSYPIDG